MFLHFAVLTSDCDNTADVMRVVSMAGDGLMVTDTWEASSDCHCYPVTTLLPTPLKLLHNISNSSNSSG